MKAYRLTTHDLRHMTPWAQLCLYSPDDAVKDGDTIFFETEAEYLEWATIRR